MVIVRVCNWDRTNCPHTNSISHASLSSLIIEILNCSYQSITFVSRGAPGKLEALTVLCCDNSSTHRPIIKSILMNRHTTRGQPIDPHDPGPTSVDQRHCRKVPNLTPLLCPVMQRRLEVSRSHLLQIKNYEHSKIKRR